MLTRFQHFQPLGQRLVALSSKLRVGLHLLHRHTCGANLLEKIDPTDIVGGVTAMGILGPTYGVNEANTLVVTQRIDAQSRCFRYLLYGEFFFLVFHVFWF